MTTQKGLLIIENCAEAEVFSEKLRESDERFRDVVVVTLNPNVRAFLKDRGIQSLSSSEIMNGDAFRAVMDKCQELETYVRSRLSEAGIESPGKYYETAYWYFMRLIWRHFLWNIELAGRCLDRGDCGWLAAFKYRRVVTQSPWIEDNQLYMGDIVERLCSAQGITPVLIDPPSHAASTCDEEPASGSTHRFFILMAHFINRVSAALLSRKKTLLVPGFKYNLGKVCNSFSEKHKGLKVGIFYLGKEGLPGILQSLAILLHVAAGKKMFKKSVGFPVDFAIPVLSYAWCNTDGYDNSIECQYNDTVAGAFEKDSGNVATFRGVRFADFLLQKLRDDLAAYMEQIAFQAFGLRRAMEAVDPDCVISQMNGELYGALGTITKDMGIPSVLISHGSHVSHSDSYGARENDILARNILVGDYRYAAVQSPLAREMALRTGMAPERIVNIPPTLWGRKVGKRSGEGNRITIVHAGTLKLRHNRRYIYETSDEFMEGLEHLIEAVRPFPRLRLILKIRPDMYELSMDTMRFLLPESDNVIVETDRPFLDVLPEADLVVSFSSTTIEEALSNAIPVLLYGGDGRYAHIPVEPFGEDNNTIVRAVSFVKTRDDLHKYMAQLGCLEGAFQVPAKAFDVYRFREHEVVDPTQWLYNLYRGRE